MNEPTRVSLNGGVYPNENGTWRVCCWFSEITTEVEANHVSQWLTKLLQNNISQGPPPQVAEAPQPQATNGAAQP
jgi:hypothetical protein